MSTTGIEHPYYPRDLKLPHYQPNDKSILEILGWLGSGVGVILIVMYIIAGRVKYLKKSIITKLKLCWFLNSAIIHIAVEGYYVYHHKTLAGHMTYMGQMWKEYAKADSRYLTSDTFTLCMETVTALVDGPLCLLVVLAFLTRQRHRYLLQLVVSLMQLYGDVLYFYTEYADDFSHVRYGHMLYFWFYFVFLNGLWIVIPLLCICDSFCVLGGAQAKLDDAAIKLELSHSTKKKYKSK